MDGHLCKARCRGRSLTAHVKIPLVDDHSGKSLAHDGVSVDQVDAALESCRHGPVQVAPGGDCHRAGPCRAGHVLPFDEDRRRTPAALLGRIGSRGVALAPGATLPPPAPSLGEPLAHGGSVRAAGKKSRSTAGMEHLLGVGFPRRTRRKSVAAGLGGKRSPRRSPPFYQRPRQRDSVLLGRSDFRGARLPRPSPRRRACCRRSRASPARPMRGSTRRPPLQTSRP
jgi:hypothetical protein